MLSFMKEDEGQDKTVESGGSSAEACSDNNEQETQTSNLSKALSSSGDLDDAPGKDFLVPSSTGTKVKYSTIILGAVFLLGAVSLFVAIKKFGPAEAEAGLSQEELQIESALAKLSGSKAEINSKMNDIVDRISGLSKVQQVDVNELKRNPFVHDTSDGGVDIKELIIKNNGTGLAGLKLWSVMESGTQKSCMINDRVYRVGDRVENYKVKKIGAGYVELDTGDRVLVLRMSK